MMKVVAIYESNFRNVSATLRVIADHIDRGDYGAVREAALVLWGGTVEVFGMGEADAMSTHYLLACGTRKMEAPMLKDPAE